MTLLYKSDDHCFKDIFLDDDRLDYVYHQNPIENSKEIDFALLDIGIPSFCESIINKNQNIQYSIDQLAKFIHDYDFIYAKQIFEPLFISTIIELINAEDSLAFNLIIFISNIWSNPINKIEILYSNELISAFCKYLHGPYELRDFVYESFHFLLKNTSENAHEQIIDILVNNNVFESLDEIFKILNSEDHSEIDKNRLFEISKRTMLFIRSITINIFFDSKFFNNIINHITPMLASDDYRFIMPYSIKILHHILIDLNQLDYFVSNLENVQILLNYHFFNDIQIFSYLYEMDSCLWKHEKCKEIYLNDSRFFNNITFLLTDPKFNDYLKPIFIFLNNTMIDIWEILYTTYVKTGPKDSERLIFIILNHSNNDTSFKNKISSGLCISSFLMIAHIFGKKDVAFNGGFDALCSLIASAEGLYLKSFLKCLLNLFNIFPEFLKDESNVNEVKIAFDNMSPSDGDDEIFTFKNEIEQLFQSCEDENM